MKKVIIITGDRGTGKSKKALELTKGLNTAFLYYQTFKKKRIVNLSAIKKETEAIVIDEVYYLSEIAPFIYLNQIIIEKQGKKPFIFDLPLIVVVTDNLKMANISSRPNFEFIDMNQKVQSA